MWERTRPFALLLVFWLPALSAVAAEDVPVDELQEALAEARTEFERGSYFRAADILNEVLAEEDDGTDARILLLRVELARGGIDEAERLDRELAERHGDDAPVAVLLARAEHAFARGRREESEALARQVLEREPGNLAARLAVARVLHDRGERAAAAAFVEESVAAAGDLNALGSDDLLDVARLFAVVGDLELASEAAVHAEARRKKEERPATDVLVVLGDLYRRAHQLDGDQPRAFKTYREALEQNSSLVAAKVGRALVHLYVNNTWDAEKEVDEALTINGRSVEALTAKAWFRVLDGRHSEALELIERALAVNPSAKWARAVRAAALHLLDRAAERDAELERVLALDPTYGEVFQVIGDALSRHTRFAEAVEFHRRALEVDPELPLALVSLGRDLCFAGAEEEALEVLGRSHESHPYSHPWRNNMEVVLRKLDREFIDTESDDFRMRVQVDENPLLGPRLEAAFAADLRHLTEKYGYTPAGQVLVEMFPEHRDFSVRTIGLMGLGAVGACFGDFVTLLSPRSELRRSFCYRRTILHELTHVMTLGRSKARVPRWLTEGISVYEERAARPTWGRDQELELIDAVANDELIPLREFNAAFRGPRIMFAYYQGGLWVEYAVKRHGFPKILELLDAFAEDLETPDAVEQVYGLTPEQVDADFLAYLRETRLDRVRVQPRVGEQRRAELRRRLRKAPDDVDLLVEAAWSYHQAGLEVDADVYLNQAIRKEPTHAAALRLAARRAMDRERPDLARQNLEAAFANGGREYHAALLLAELLAQDRDHAGAIAALEIARECFPWSTGPENPDLALFRLLSGEGRMAEAMAALRRFCDRAESAVKPRMDLARWLMHQGEHAEALRYLREAEDVDPFVRQLHLDQAEALRALGRPADAVKALRTALLVDPRLEPDYTPARGTGEDEEPRRQADILLQIAEIELEAGDLAGAERDLHQALRLWPDSPRAQELLDELRR